jgi:hypothetical protein
MDENAPVIAKYVYGQLFNSIDDKVDFSIVPYALDEAVQKLREDGLPVRCWAPFVHFGA